MVSFMCVFTDDFDFDCQAGRVTFVYPTHHGADAMLPVGMGAIDVAMCFGSSVGAKALTSAAPSRCL